MRTIVTAIFLAASVIGLTAAKAMPVASLGEAAANASLIETTSGGCGRFFHRGPYGGCRPLYSCPPGWHTGPFGQVCFRNW